MTSDSWGCPCPMPHAPCPVPSSRRNDSCLERLQSLPYRPIEHAITDAHDDAAEYRRIHVHVGHNSFRERTRELRSNHIAIGFRYFTRESDLRVHPIAGLVHEVAVFDRDLRQQHLAAVLYQLLDEPHHQPRQAVCEGLSDYDVFFGSRNLRRGEKVPQSYVTLHGAHHAIQRRTPALECIRLASEN